MTIVTPGAKAMLICSVACSALAALICEGSVTMTGGGLDFPLSHGSAAPSGRSKEAARRFVRPGPQGTGPRVSTKAQTAQAGFPNP
jgi:hypothetical protein